MANVLIIDDDREMNYTLAAMVDKMGYDVVPAYTLREGLQEATEKKFDVVLLDIHLPDGNGLNALPSLRESSGRPEVIIITGSGDMDGAELAITNGAWDYIEKTSSILAMTLPLLRAMQYKEEKKKQDVTPILLNRQQIIGDSPAIRHCLDHVAKASISDANVLITGETGTGKELFARTIHENSRRRNGNFVIVDCASMPENLVASMLFGHEKGAFTGADKASSGLIKHADGGTLFLDEIGELPFSMQKAFLRITQERSFRPVGSKREEESDFRLLAATNRNLDDMARNGQFRSDLLFRLRTLTIHLPSLRERKKDIQSLAMFYMNRLCEQHCTDIKGFSPDFFRSILEYEWPGNVRELFNTIETTFLAAYNDPILFTMHLPVPLRVKLAQASITSHALEKSHLETSLDPAGPHPKLREFRQQVVNSGEKFYLENLMGRTRGNMKEACEISGLARARLYELFTKHNIDKTS
ncbi:MAG: sigma-54-dependent Fis family transcriptional regulator [Deltaproteobacteria bacterium]|nr:sigma-54-dependent Fis family transcriptional regulator [Deltaproteobacteria bacterium]